MLGFPLKQIPVPQLSHTLSLQGRGHLPLAAIYGCRNSGADCGNESVGPIKDGGCTQDSQWLACGRRPLLLPELREPADCGGFTTTGALRGSVPRQHDIADGDTVPGVLRVCGLGGVDRLGK